MIWLIPQLLHDFHGQLAADGAKLPGELGRGTDGYFHLPRCGRAQRQQVPGFQRGGLAGADGQPAPTGADLDGDIVERRVPAGSRAGWRGGWFWAGWPVAVEFGQERPRLAAARKPGQ